MISIFCGVSETDHVVLTVLSQNRDDLSTVRMSTIDYNALVFRVSRKLDELNEPEQLVFMCRDLLPSESESDIQDALLLLRKLEECKHLGPDRLEMMKDILKMWRNGLFLEELKSSKEKDGSTLICLNRSFVSSTNSMIWND